MKLGQRLTLQSPLRKNMNGNVSQKMHTDCILPNECIPSLSLLLNWGTDLQCGCSTAYTYSTKVVPTPCPQQLDQWQKTYSGEWKQSHGQGTMAPLQRHLSGTFSPVCICHGLNVLNVVSMFSKGPDDAYTSTHVLPDPGRPGPWSWEQETVTRTVSNTARALFCFHFQGRSEARIFISPRIDNFYFSNFLTLSYLSRFLNFFY